jgi:Flp pilus assembly protein TadG
MIGSLRRDRHELQKGQDLVEYALALPIVLLILMSILDLGRVIYVYSSLHNSVRDGARYGIINPTDAAGIEALVRTKAVGLDPFDLTVTVVQPDLDTIRVGATYLFPVVSPVVSVMVGGSPWPVGSQATMRVEG